MTAVELTCERDGVPTRLTCTGCGSGICPKCMLRTPVGFKCPTCVGSRGRSRRRVPPTALVAALVAVGVLAWALFLRPTHKQTVEPVAPGAVAQAGPTTQAMLGEEALDGQLSFVVTDFSCGAKELAVGAATRTAEGKFCQMRLNARNTSGAPATLLGRFQYLLDGQSKTYGPDLGLSQAVAENGNRSLSELDINPDITVAMVLVFDVPDGLDPKEAQLRGTGRSRFGVRVRLERRAG